MNNNELENKSTNVEPADNNKPIDYEEQYMILAEEEKAEERRKTILIVILCILIILVSIFGASYSFLNYEKNKQLTTCRINCDTNRDGKCDRNCDINNDNVAEVNLDIDGDGKCDINCNKDQSKKPQYNIDLYGDRTLHFAIDTNNDGIGDFNPINQDNNKDGKCDVNCDINNDGWPEINIDLDGDTKPDINIDTDNDNICNFNCDTNKDGYPELNIDNNGDKICDVNCDTNNDGKPDYNIDYDHDYTPHFNIDNNNDGKGEQNLIGTKTNIDTNNDGWPDINIDVDGDGICDINCDTNNDGKADNNINAKCSKCSYNSYQPTVIISSSNKASVVVNSIKNIDAKDIIPGWKGTLKFSITNNSSKSQRFNLYWKNIQNTFTETNNMNYTLNNGMSNLITDQKVPYRDGILIQNILIPANYTYYYTMTYEFKETGINQDIDIGKKFFANIDVQLVR